MLTLKLLQIKSDSAVINVGIRSPITELWANVVAWVVKGSPVPFIVRCPRCAVSPTGLNKGGRNRQERNQERAQGAPDFVAHFCN